MTLARAPWWRIRVSASSRPNGNQKGKPVCSQKRSAEGGKPHPAAELGKEGPAVTGHGQCSSQGDDPVVMSVMDGQVGGEKAFCNIEDQHQCSPAKPGLADGVRRRGMT